ncbi:tyrosine-type recombinase/integrase [Novosphingobium sp.]|uniref:tyrosine-type recombinase/integrase n=1 Tax=Novosphingobium sp. TaxID=1874826 RepID=UPI00260E561E|nr:tyrosine-type recombinase/integrase [Novosphingobium sp.]
MAIRKRAWTLPDGTAKQAWLVDYRDQAGKRRAKQFARKRDAEEWAITAKAEVQRGVHTPDRTSVTIAKASELWLDTVRKNGREPTTVAAYEQQVRLHIVPACGATKLSQLTAPKVRTILDSWRGSVSRPMATRLLRTLKAIISDAQERGLVAQNVALAVKMPRETREKGKVTPPAKADLRAILKAAAAQTSLKAQTFVELAVFSGMRASELRGLPWRNVDLKAGTVTVDQRADAAGVIGPPKSTAGFRTIPLPPRVIKLLKAWKLACPANDLELVFPSDQGKPLSHRVATINLVGPIQIAARVVTTTIDEEGDPSFEPRYGLHAFRHAAASLWIEQGLNAKRVQVLMGHSSIQVTFDTYGHLFEQQEKDRDDAAAIERALFTGAT